MPKRKQTEAQRATQFKRLDYIYSAEKYLNTNNTYNRDKLLKDALRVAKSTNQRLLRLEKAGYTSAPAYKGAEKALSGVYSKSGEVPFGTVKAGKPRFASAGQIKKMTNEELRALLYSASKTQTAVTSTPASVEKVYGKARERLNKMFESAGLNLSYNDIMYVMKNEAYQKAMKLFGYKNILQMISEVDEEEEDNLYNLGEELAKIITEQMANGELNVLTLREKLGLKPLYIPKSKFMKSF